MLTVRTQPERLRRQGHQRQRGGREAAALRALA